MVKYGTKKVYSDYIFDILFFPSGYGCTIYDLDTYINIRDSFCVTAHLSTFLETKPDPVKRTY